MSNYQKKFVPVEKTSLYLDGQTLKSVLKDIQEYISLYGEDATISEGRHLYSEGTYLGIFANEIETDKQFDDRIKREEQLKKQREDWERQDFERLKAKYKE